MWLGIIIVVISGQLQAFAEPFEDYKTCQHQVNQAVKAAEPHKHAVVLYSKCVKSEIY